MEKYYDNGLALWGLKCGERRITGPMYLKVFDIKGQWAAVRFENEGTGIVNDKGETVKRLPDFQQLVFEENDFLKITNVRDFFIDLRSMKLYASMPENRFFGEFELLFIGDWIYTRTKQHYGVEEKLGCPPCLCDDGLYLTIPCNEMSMTEHLQYHDKEDEPWSENLEKWVDWQNDKACLIAGDDSQAYWLYRRLVDGTIVIIDNKLRFYHVTGVKDEEGRMKAVKLLVAQADDKTKVEEVDMLLQPIEIEAKEKVAEHKRKTIEDEKRLRELRLKQLKDAVPFKMGNKWGLKLQDRIVVPPLYHSVKNPVGQYCAVEKNQRHWGIMAVDGKMVVEPKYEDAEVFQDGTAVLTVYKGKTVLRKLKE